MHEITFILPIADMSKVKIIKFSRIIFKPRLEHNLWSTSSRVLNSFYILSLSLMLYLLNCLWESFPPLKSNDKLSLFVKVTLIFVGFGVKKFLDVSLGSNKISVYYFRVYKICIFLLFSIKSIFNKIFFISSIFLSISYNFI